MKKTVQEKKTVHARKTVVVLVFVLILLLGLLLGAFLAWSAKTVQEEPTVPNNQEVTEPPKEPEKPDNNMPAGIVVLGIQKVPEEEPPVPEVVVPPVKEPLATEIVPAVPLIEAQPLQGVISDVPSLVDKPVEKQEEDKPIEIVKPRIKPASYLYFCTGVPVQTMPANVVTVSSSQWFITPVLVPQVIPIQVRTYQYYRYYYSIGYVTPTIVY